MGHLKPETIEKIRIKAIGRKHSEETKQKISAIRKGSVPWNKGTKGLVKPNSGSFVKGQFAKEKHPNWKGGISSINHLIRTSIEFKEWRKFIYERDKYTCRVCGKVGGKLNADHIKPFAYFPELRFNVDNGRTLCIECHRLTETFSGKGNWKLRKRDAFGCFT
jgi:5-methylcytosine-specific restriction endonuclease McrA